MWTDGIRREFFGLMLRCAATSDERTHVLANVRTTPRADLFKVLYSGGVSLDAVRATINGLEPGAILALPVNPRVAERYLFRSDLANATLKFVVTCAMLDRTLLDSAGVKQSLLDALITACHSSLLTFSTVVGRCLPGALVLCYRGTDGRRHVTPFALGQYLVEIESSSDIAAWIARRGSRLNLCDIIVTGAVRRGDKRTGGERILSTLLHVRSAPAPHLGTAECDTAECAAAAAVAVAVPRAAAQASAQFGLPISDNPVSTPL